MTTQQPDQGKGVVILDDAAPADAAAAQPQGDFFGQQQAAPTGSPRKRLFAYDSQYWQDPGPEYTVEDVLSFLADTYPELKNGTWSSRTLPDGTEEFTFVKVTGEKGGGLAAEVAARLCTGTTPTDIYGVDLLHRLAEIEEERQLSADLLLANAPQIEAALDQTARIAQYSQRMVARCLALKPTPLPGIPVGF